MNLSNLPHRPAASFAHSDCIVGALKMNDALSAVKHSESTDGEGILRHPCRAPSRCMPAARLWQ